MPTDVENLEAARSSLIEKIATLEAQRAIDMSVDGESYALNGEINGCYERLGKINELIAKMDGPIHVRSYGRACG